MPERIVSLYELLTNKCPGDESLLCQLFLAYVRVRNYKQQQKVAMQLYKEFNLTPYLMWSIMSIVMQVWWVLKYFRKYDRHFCRKIITIFCHLIAF